MNENVLVNLSEGMDSMSSALVYMVRISDSHSDGPGSIPGCGTFFIFPERTAKSWKRRQCVLAIFYDIKDNNIIIDDYVIKDAKI